MMPSVLDSLNEQLIVASPVQVLTAVAPVPSGATEYWMRTSFGGAGALNVTPKVTPSGKSLCGSSDWTTIACCAWSCGGDASASVATARAGTSIRNLRNGSPHLRLQVRPDHVVEIAFEHSGGVARLIAGAVILHHLVRV